MLVYQTNPVGVVHVSYVNTSFCANNFAELLFTRLKRLYRGILNSHIQLLSQLKKRNSKRVVDDGKREKVEASPLLFFLPMVPSRFLVSPPVPTSIRYKEASTLYVSIKCWWR